MKSRARQSLLAGLVSLTLAAALTSCGVHGLHIQQSPLLRFFSRTSGHIAYIGTDGNLFVSDQDGKSVQLTHDAQGSSGPHVTYVSPTWGPEGKRLAVARYAANPANGSSTVSLEIIDWQSKKSTVALKSSNLKPFYFNWSPHGRYVAILSDTSGSHLELGVASADQAGSYRRLDSGAPYYWSWTPDGSRLVAHTDFTETKGGRLSLVPVAAGAGAITNLKGQFGFFQAPAVTPGGRVVTVTRSGNEQHLALLNPVSDTTTELPTGKGSAIGYLFSLSPNGKMLAYLEPKTSGGHTESILHVYDLSNHKELDTLTGSSTLAFYWSPDSSRIALLAPGGTKVPAAYSQITSLPHLDLRVLEVRSGKSWTITTFPPTQNLLTTLPFTDQYQHSQTIWAPDGKHLVYAAYAKDSLPGIFVADASGNIEPTKLASGDSVAWSWK